MTELNDMNQPIAQDHAPLCLIRLALQQEIAHIPDGMRWLELVEQGYSAWQATRALGRSAQWLREVREACRRAIW